LFEKETMGKVRELIGSVVKEKPTVTLDSKTLPAIKKWKVGKKYCILLEVEQVSLSKDEYGDDDKQLHARFRINNAKEYEDE